MRIRIMIEIIKNKNLRINEKNTVDLLPNSQFIIILLMFLSNFVLRSILIDTFGVECDETNVNGVDIVDFPLK